jgi:small subunit ribosomal protein S13e
MGWGGQVVDQICKLAKKGLRPSQIGVLLRDMHGITQVKSVTGSKVLRILKGQGLAPDIPEDLYYLIKKAVSMRKHLEGNRKDKDGKFRLILVESRIHRLARYYKVTFSALPLVFQYFSCTVVNFLSLSVFAPSSSRDAFFLCLLLSPPPASLLPNLPLPSLSFVSVLHTLVCCLLLWSGGERSYGKALRKGSLVAGK